MSRSLPTYGSDRAWFYYGLTFGLALLVALAARWLGHATLLLTMITLAVCVIFMLCLIRPEAGGAGLGFRELGLTRPDWRGWLPAIALPTALLGGGTLLMAALGVTALGPPAAYLSVADAILNLVAALVIGSVLAVFEEVGWRG